MAVYLYQAKQPGGKVVRGEVQATSEVEARVKIRSQQLIPIRVMPKSGAKGVKKTGIGKIKPKELQVFTRQFATMIDSGIPISQALQILADGTQSPPLKKVLSGVKEDLNSGKRLAESMQSFPGAFDKLYVNLVRAGEEGGVLDTILDRLAMYIEKAAKIRGQIKSAMTYPAIILLVSALVIGVILGFVIPKFMELFRSTGQELPEITQMVVDWSDFLREKWYVVLIGGAAVFTSVKVFVGTPAGKTYMDNLVIRIPVLGTLVQKAEIARFSRTMSTLIASGVPLLDGLDICAQTIGNQVIAESIVEARAVVSEGKSIISPLAKNPFIPDMVVQMIGVGEQTGALDTMLEKIADFYEDEVDEAVSALTSIMEPLMMVFLGGIIAFLVIAMYMPIFNMAGGIT
ncbi:MAG: type II secretion system F family protein [Bdellovibrionota bacterium]|nr:pilus assembly protein PilC [Pseudobdellovibrionaceae bacterium]|tara:strand:+ start:28342 stop:29547 length:1206 start_codon:yes stop_codon:yes gene_type:complete